MTTAQEKKPLTKTQYEFYKRKGMTDEMVMNLHQLNTFSLNAWKKEHKLIGVKFEKDLKVEQVTVSKATVEEPKLLKEKDIPQNSLSKSAAETEKVIQEYKANKAIQEKLKAKESKPTVINVKESDFLVSESKDNGTIGEIPYSPLDTSTDTAAQEFKMPEVNDVIEPDYEKEIAWLEERHVKDSDTIEQLQIRLKAAEYHETISKVNAAVKSERYRQNKLYGHQRHSNGDWLMILTEEVGEVAQAMQKSRGWGKETDADNLYEELIHVAAVASAIAEQVLEERS